MSYSKRSLHFSSPILPCFSCNWCGTVTYRVEYFYSDLGGNACVAQTRLITNAKLAHSYSKFYNTAAVAVVLSTDLYAPSFALEEVGWRGTRLQQTTGVWGNNYFIHITVGMCARARACVYLREYVPVGKENGCRGFRALPYLFGLNR
jgi:hypothetical protein